MLILQIIDLRMQHCVRVLCLLFIKEQLLLRFVSLVDISIQLIISHSELRILNLQRSFLSYPLRHLSQILVHKRL